MLVILSQKVDSASSYKDELFKTYHYPAKYKNQLREGDTFIYYQGNRHEKSQRYYFGVGTIGEILIAEDGNFYARLVDCRQFEKKVPIYLPDGGYIEQLGYETVRTKINPPWQSSVRPLSRNAFDYLLTAADITYPFNNVEVSSVDQLKNSLKLAVKEFYVEGDCSAVYRIANIASAIGRIMSGSDEALPVKTDRL